MHPEAPACTRLARLSHQLQPGHRRRRPGLVDPLDGEAHVDQNPVTDRQRGLVAVVEHADVDLSLGAHHVDEDELIAVALDPCDHLAGNSETHVNHPPPSVRLIPAP